MRLALLAFLLPLPALAADTLSGDTIRALVSGNTIAGGMLASGPYAEHYAADGTIRGAGYTGKWTITGDFMCFAYDAAPVCYGVALAGDEVQWLLDGKVDGTGRVTPGNPNGF